MRQELTSLEGVVSADVSFGDKRAEVVYRPESVRPEQLVAAVDKTGFKARLVPAEEKAATGAPGGEAPATRR